MNDPRLISELPSIITKLEVLSTELNELSRGSWDNPKASLFKMPAREVGSALSNLKSDTFLRAWESMKNEHSLRNADDDGEAKRELEREFKLTDGLCYPILENYFQRLQGQADGLALEAILKEAKRAVPHRFFHPSYGEEKGKPEDLVRKCVVKLRLYRDSYFPDRLSSYAYDQLAALDKLGQIAVKGVAAKHAHPNALAREYGWGQECNGRRTLSYGPFIGCQSFKNSRLDLKFKNRETALDFAYMLVTGELRQKPYAE